MKEPVPSFSAVPSSFLARLARDRSGNVIAMVAAALFPLLALIGGGIDMGRGYLAQSRLQQACDAGVLAARKRIGTGGAVDGSIPEDAGETGQRFFNINFGDGDYGTENRQFDMTLEEDNSISGFATVDVPTTLMQVFGFTVMPVSVSCMAQLNMQNTDIMMVLDVTGSMAQTNPGDDVDKITALRSTVRSFYGQMSANAPVGTRVRYGFVPYATNVNVGGLLEDDWVVDEWHYQSREMVSANTQLGTRTYERNHNTQSGTKSENNVVSTYAASWSPAGGMGGTYSCTTPLPADTATSADTRLSRATYPFVGPPTGTQTVEDHRRTRNGSTYENRLTGSTCEVIRTDYFNHTETYQEVTEPALLPVNKWRYAELDMDVSDWRSSPASNGCIEERDTYEIADYDNVDLNRALDLNLDLVPTSDDATKWRPMYPYNIYARSLLYNGTGLLSLGQVLSTLNFVQPAALGRATCPAPARGMAEMTAAEVDDYLATLSAAGSTYHDIGMIWGGRLLSPTGLFAEQNADLSPRTPTTRHLIFLTDGETAPYDVNYSTYGFEPLDKRRWSANSALTLTQTVERRFAFACEEVKKRNITVWVISFGTSANPVMEACAGPDQYFVADDAAQLETVFSQIANRMAELRVTG